MAAGVVTVFWPGLAALPLIFMMGTWAIAIALFEIAEAVALRERNTGNGWICCQVRRRWRSV